MKPRSIRFRCLDGIRGISAIGVMFYHLMPDLPGGALSHGFLAVDLFFLLSGFVIAYTYEAKLAGGWSLTRFALARAIRLYPLVTAAVISVVLLRSIYPYLTVPSADFLWAAFLNAMLLPNFSQSSADQFPIIAPTWSLFFEIVVNLGYAAALPWITKQTLRWIIIVSGALLTIYGWQAGSVELLHHHLDAGLARTIFSFSLGLWMFRNMQRIRTMHNLVPGWLAYAGTILVLMSPRLTTGEWLFELIAIAAIFPLITIVALNAVGSPAVNRTEDLLGELSYPVYLLHMPVAAYTGAAVGWLLSGYLLSITTAGATIAVSIGAWKLYDQPVRKWLGMAINRRHVSVELRAEP